MKKHTLEFNQDQIEYLFNILTAEAQYREPSEDNYDISDKDFENYHFDSVTLTGYSVKANKDSLLPLANHWKGLRAKGETIGVCTARVLQDADYQFLADNGLDCDFILSRQMGDSSGDGVLKEKLLRQYADKISTPFETFTANIKAFYDDNKIVLETLDNLNIKGYNALELNKKLKSL